MAEGQKDCNGYEGIGFLSVLGRLYGRILTVQRNMKPLLVRNKVNLGKRRGCENTRFVQVGTGESYRSKEKCIRHL